MSVRFGQWVGWVRWVLTVCGALRGLPLVMSGVGTTHWVAESVPSRGRAPGWPDRDLRWRVARLASCGSYTVPCGVTIVRREAPLGSTLSWAPSSRLLGLEPSLSRVFRVSDVRLCTHGCLDYLFCARPSAPMRLAPFLQRPVPCDCSRSNRAQPKFRPGRGGVIGPFLTTPVRAPVGD